MLSMVNPAVVAIDTTGKNAYDLALSAPSRRYYGTTVLSDAGMPPASAVRR